MTLRFYLILIFLNTYAVFSHRSRSGRKKISNHCIYTCIMCIYVKSNKITCQVHTLSKIVPHLNMLYTFFFNCKIYFSLLFNMTIRTRDDNVANEAFLNCCRKEGTH